MAESRDLSLGLQTIRVEPLGSLEFVAGKPLGARAAGVGGTVRTSCTPLARAGHTANDYIRPDAHGVATVRSNPVDVLHLTMSAFTHSHVSM